MRIALLGYGKMGKAIEKIALDRGHEIVLKIGSKNINELTLENVKKADVAIDFSMPHTAFDFISVALNAKVPTISGTTAWLENLSEIEQLASNEQTGFIYASNFSLGVNLFFEMNKRVAELMNPQENFEVSMKEIHHIHKVDKPSGTAISIAEGIFESGSDLKDWTLDNEVNKLQIDVERTGEVPGTHSVEYKSAYDKITIEHEAINRNGFALGAVVAAEWIIGRKGVFSMKDVLFSN